jgi:hypothetical protein
MLKLSTMDLCSNETGSIDLVRVEAMINGEPLLVRFSIFLCGARLHGRASVTHGDFRVPAAND